MNCNNFLQLLSTILVSLFLLSCNSEQAGLTIAAETVHDHKAHGHSVYDAFSANPAALPPQINLSVTADTVSGWNLHIDVINFRFAPEKINQAVTDATEGHAHLYVDGYKLARLYGDWYHLKPLTPGQHTLKVNLTTNDHSSLYYNGVPIEATLSITEQ
jgi:hypothetical protein